MKSVYVVVLIMALRAGGVPYHEEQPRTFCGRHLADARLLYCFGVTEDMRKRSSLMNVPLLALLRPEWATTGSTTLLELLGQRFIQSTKRVGIADECCLKPCYISDLLYYC